MSARRRKCAVLLALALAVAAPAITHAQDVFGQNKVQYKGLRWSVLQTTHFDVYFYEGEREAAIDAARMAERAYDRLSTILNHQIQGKVPLILYASQSDFQATNVTPGLISEGTGGFTDYQKRRVTIPFTGGYGDLDHVMTHELVHAFQVDILFGHGDRALSNPFGGYTPPLWFMEGMAEYLSITKVDNLTQMWLRDAALQGYLIPLNVLDYTGDIRVYRFGQSIFEYIGRTFGDDRIGDLLKRVGRTRSTARAFEDVLGMSEEKLSQDWMEDIRKTYLPQIREHQKPEEFARRLTDSEEDLSSYNLAPAVSPAGDQMVYISDRSLYNDLYLASALDGRVETRLIKGDRAEAFESLRFINASIDFSPDGGTVAFSSKVGASDAIYIQRISDGRILRKISFDLDGIDNPSFSPDGQWLVFVGLDGGRSDLFRCRVDGSGFERLTNDRFLDLAPRYAPDGNSVVFVTDQDSTTDFKNLIFAPPRLALLDIRTREIRVLPGMPGTNTAPHFFPDGRHILYVSDRTGIANIYIRDLDTGLDARITDILTGVTGIIPLTPPVSLARDGHRLVFSAFSQGKWDLYAIKDPLSMARFEAPTPAPVNETAPGPPPAAAGAVVAAATAPTPPAASDSARAGRPPARGQGLAFRAAIDSLAALPIGAGLEIAHHAAAPPAVPGRADSARVAPAPPPKIGEVFALHRALPDTTGFKFDKYRIHFTIDYAGASGFFASNVGVAAQTLLYFSDVLGDHNIVVGADVYGSIADSNLLFSYTNLARRTNWGVAVYQFRDDFLLSTAQTNDQYVSQIYRGGEVNVSRPFDRFRRIELSLEGLEVDEKVYQQAYFGPDVYTYENAGQNSLYFVRPGVALIHDNAVWGITGPISGGRSSYSADVSFGDIHTSRWIMDRRSYWNVRQRYTFALRMIGATSQGRDPQVFRIGGPYTLHGTSYGDIEGSNLALVNLEFRFPLIETLELGWPLPIGFRWIRGAAFFDTGGAWRDNRLFKPVDDSNGFRLRDLEAAYGIGAAINLGFAVVRWDVAWPTNLRSNLGSPRGTVSFGGDF